MTHAQQTPARYFGFSDYMQWTRSMWHSKTVDESALSGLKNFDQSLIVASMGLAGETFEIIEPLFQMAPGEQRDSLLLKELGDVLYYLCFLSSVFEVELGLNLPVKPSASSDKEEVLNRYFELQKAVGVSTEFFKKFVRQDLAKVQAVQSKNKAVLGPLFQDIADSFLRLCEALNLEVDAIIRVNQNKLSKRAKSGTLRGDGNDR